MGFDIMRESVLNPVMLLIPVSDFFVERSIRAQVVLPELLLQYVSEQNMVMETIGFKGQKEIIALYFTEIGAAVCAQQLNEHIECEEIQTGTFPQELAHTGFLFGNEGR